MIVRRMKQLTLGLIIMLCSGMFLAPSFVSAAPTNFQGDACAGLNGIQSDTSSTTCTSGSSTVTTIVKLVINIFSFVVGVTAVIMIIYGGFKFITANGDSGSVGTARSTILYALIGLVIVALSQILVHYVLTETASSTSAHCTVAGKTSLSATDPNCK